MKPIHYALIAIALLLVWLHLRSRKATASAQDGIMENFPAPGPAEEPKLSVRPGRIPLPEMACPSGFVYANGQCQWRYQAPWKWPGYNRPI
jgi:hypothetical protein